MLQREAKLAWASRRSMKKAFYTSWRKDFSELGFGETQIKKERDIIV